MLDEIIKKIEIKSDVESDINKRNAQRIANGEFQPEHVKATLCTSARLVGYGITLIPLYGVKNTKNTVKSKFKK